ncbi:MAG: hypothetical protein H0U57_03605 [Tatlockia sp.]|nr:hypothetical protein [Tatlockia sp.]
MKTPIFYLLTMLLLTGQVKAEALTFKEAIAPKPSWHVYLLAIFALLAILYTLAKKSKRDFFTPSSLRIIDKKRLSAKTFLFVLEYRNEHFLVADNQHTLAFQVLKPSSQNEQTQIKMDNLHEISS